jgi:hypothetical protein
MNSIQISSRYIAHERQCQDHVRYQEHQGKPDNQFAISLRSVHILLADFPTGASDSAVKHSSQKLMLADLSAAM